MHGVHKDGRSRGPRKRYDQSKVRKRKRRERLERDKWVTSEYGMRGHNSCGRKVRYETEHDAMSHATLSRLMGCMDLHAYECPYCGGWHLTHK